MNSDMKTLHDLLEFEFSKTQRQKIFLEIVNERISISTVLNSFAADIPIISQRIGFLLTKIQDERIDLLLLHLNQIWSALKPNSHDGVTRAVFRLFSTIKVPEDLEGEVFENGLILFKKKTTSIAIKVFIMTTVVNIALKHPDLKSEVAFLIKEQIPGSSAGYKSRANRELKRLVF